MEENQTASTSANYTDTMALLPDPSLTDLLDYSDLDSITRLFNETVSINTDRFDNENTTRIEGFSIFEGAEWLTWVIFALGLLLIIGILAAIITYIVYNKKRVIRTGNHGVPRGFSNYENESTVGYPTWLCCCLNLDKDKRDNLKVARQNSASNLDPYKRQPLPPIKGTRTNGDGYQGTHIVPNRLEPLQLQADYSNKSNNIYQTKCSVIEDDIANEDLFGIQIKAIKGVPVIQLCKDEKRSLPNPPFSRK
uniref:Uncharacterized protein n=1 Tax=Syphacia muris TaxID=451379 RepID=A0A0N5ANV3_9BILA